MSIPEKTTVLVVGGGPAGSLAACALAREGIDTVIIEADKFPRYHIGESMLPSLRHFLRFVDLEDTFVNHGFKIKKGAVFKLNARPPAYTDFIAGGGPNAFTWNVVRSEADELIFRHAEKSGAKVFDGVKVNSLEFVPHNKESTADEKTQDPGRPVSASWSSKDGSSGVINFEYLIDASGRFGLMSTKYLKNRRYNSGLKNIATWGYWKNCGDYGVGTSREGDPYFEALKDASGWVWFIPLHNGVTSIGVVVNQDVATRRKKEMGSPTGREFYLEMLKDVPQMQPLFENGILTEEPIKSASDWSYSASAYASHNTRIAGDAGCFIDPFFSSGVHLALASGLSAATTICASLKGQCSEFEAGKWHSAKVGEGYTRFLLVVLSALKQIRQSDAPVLADFDEEGFDRAFAHFRPIIQGTADVKGKLTQEEVSKTVDFCFEAFIPGDPSEREAVLKKLEGIQLTGGNDSKELSSSLSPDEMRILNTVRAREMLRSEDTMDLETFETDIINGLSAHLVRGELGLTSQAKAKSKDDVMSRLVGEDKIFSNAEMKKELDEMKQELVELVAA